MPSSGTSGHRGDINSRMRKSTIRKVKSGRKTSLIIRVLNLVGLFKGIKITLLLLVSKNSKKAENLIIH